MAQQYTAVVPSPLGLIGILAGPEGLKRLDYLDQAPQRLVTSGLAARVSAQLQAYFDGRREDFILDLDLQGTDFQLTVWQALLAIPHGETLTYGEVAKKIGSSARAIGGACRANPVPVIVPCHRVLGKNSIGGYAGHESGEMVDRKSWLLRHEQGDAQ